MLHYTDMQLRDIGGVIRKANKAFPVEKPIVSESIVHAANSNSRMLTR